MNQYDFIKPPIQTLDIFIPICPTLIIPDGTKKYQLQVHGVSCHHFCISGKLFPLPKLKYHNEGSIFISHFWAAHGLDSYLRYKNLENQANFIYNLIDDEITRRCSKIDLKNIQSFPRIWHTPYTHIKCDRLCPLNGEALIAVDCKYKNKDIKAVLTWKNCD